MTINGEQVSVDLQEMFQAENLVMYDEDRSNAYHCPNNVDIGFQNYNQASHSNATPLASYQNMTLQSQHVPDGSFVPSAFLTPTGGVLKDSETYASSNGVTVQGVDTKNPGSGKEADNIILSAPSPVPSGTSFQIYVRWYLEETPWISPLLYNGENGLEHEGIWGVKQLRLNLGIVPRPNVIRNSSNASGVNFTLTSQDYHTASSGSPFVSPQLHYQAMEPPYNMSSISQINTLPMYNFEVYPKSYSQQLGAYQKNYKIRSENIQIGAIPDKLMVLARPKPQDLSAQEADFHFVPESLSIRLGNDTNLLQTFDQGDLYNMVRKYIPVPYDTFLGRGVASDGSYIPLTSAPIVADFGEDIELQTGLASGVNTHTNLAVEMTVANQTGTQYSAVEIVVVLIESQFLYNQQGHTQRFGGFLTEADVLEHASEWKGTHTPDMKLGGGKGLKSLFGSLGNKASQLGRQALSQAGNEAIQQGAKLGKQGIQKGADALSKSIRG